jgi:hypothetical protein
VLSQLPEVVSLTRFRTAVASQLFSSLVFCSSVSVFSVRRCFNSLRILSSFDLVAVARSFVKHSRQMEKDYRASFPTDAMIRLAVFTLVVLCIVGCVSSRSPCLSRLIMETFSVVMSFSKSDLNRNVVDGAISPRQFFFDRSHSCCLYSRSTLDHIRHIWNPKSKRCLTCLRSQY